MKPYISTMRPWDSWIEDSTKSLGKGGRIADVGLSQPTTKEDAHRRFMLEQKKQAAEYRRRMSLPVA